LDSLKELADARAVRHVLRLETVLRDALRPLADRIELAFVFGSTARNRQHAESDIDLFVLGDVTLKAISEPLRRAENTLGRRISPVIYTRESFHLKVAAGDPFLLDVCRREKIPVLLPKGRTSREDLDHELRTMAAERVAATQ
jgi:predicted nucleotidyltransferase